MKKVLIKVAIAIVTIVAVVGISMNCKSDFHAYIIEDGTFYQYELDDRRNVIESTKTEVECTLFMPSGIPTNEYFVVRFADTENSTYKWAYL